MMLIHRTTVMFLSVSVGYLAVGAGISLLFSRPNRLYYPVFHRRLKLFLIAVGWPFLSIAFGLLVVGVFLGLIDGSW